MSISRFALSLTLLTSSLAFAQQAQTRHNAGQGEQRFEQRLAQRLGLSADQQGKVHAALVESRTMSQGMNEQMRTLQTSLHNAIKAGDEGQIDTVTRDISSLHQQQTAISAKATAKIYSTLTADQKTKVGEHLEMLGGSGFGPRGRGFGGPGRGPAQR
jgi:Spy/CpxP family protein refolding chaperone